MKPQQTQRTQQSQLSRNIWTSWVGYALRMAIGFLFVPYITTVLGDARYGVWVIVFQTINYFTMLDFGLEKALLRFVSKHLARSDFPGINRILNTTFAIYSIVGTLIIVGAWLTSTFLFSLFEIDDPALMVEGQQALVIIGIYMGLRFYLLPFAGSLGAFQRFDISNLLHMLEDILRAGVMVLMLYQGYGLVPLAGAILGMSLLKQLAAIIWLKRLFPEVKIAPRLAERARASELFDYSKITFGITLAWLVIFNTDAVILGTMISSAAAGIFAPGAQLMLYLRNAVNVIASPLTAAVSQMEAEGDMDGVRRIYIKGVRYTAYLAFAMATGVIIYARPFTHLWLAPEFGEASEVMRVLAVSTAFFIPQIVGNAILFGIDKHKALLQVLTIEAVVKIILSFVLIPRYGMIGMAYAAAIPQLGLYITLYPILIGRALDLSPATILLTTVRSGLAAMFVTLPVAVIVRELIAPVGWASFAVNVTAVVIPSVIAGWFVMTPEDRTAVRRRLGF